MCVLSVSATNHQPLNTTISEIPPPPRQHRQCVLANAPSGPFDVHQCFAQKLHNVAVTGRTTHAPRDWPFGGIRSWTSCASSRNSASRSQADGACTWLRVVVCKAIHHAYGHGHQRGAVVCDAASLIRWCAKTFLCLLCLIPCCWRYRMHFMFEQEVLREATSTMCRPTPSVGVSISSCTVISERSVGLLQSRAYGMHSPSHVPWKWSAKSVVNFI